MKKCTLFFAALCCAIMANAAPKGALSRPFSIAEGKQVYFSKGNLQIKPFTYEWRFAPYQYEVAGKEANEQIQGSADVYIDLFGWGTSGWTGSTAVAHMPWDASDDDADYVLETDFHKGLTGDNANADWGVENRIEGAGDQYGLWRTLTSEEWKYLLFERPEAEDKRALASVGGVYGLVVLPDEWNMPDGLQFTPGATDWTTNRYAQSAVEWDEMDAKGALFLPCAGFRSGTEVHAVNMVGCYWSTSYYDATSAFAVTIEDMIGADLGGLARHQGLSVRLVQDVVTESIDQANSQELKANSQKLFRDGQLLIERNGKTFNATGTQVK